MKSPVCYLLLISDKLLLILETSQILATLTLEIEVMRIALFFILFFFLCFAGRAQDSLHYYLSLSSTPESGNLHEAVEAGKRCVELSRIAGNNESQMQCRLALSRNYYDLGQPWEAERTLLPAIQLARATHTDSLLFRSLLFQHEILNSTDRPEEAWPLLQESQLLATSLNDSLLLARAYFSIGYFILYYNKMDAEIGMEYLENALGIFRRKGHSQMIAPTMRRIARYTKDKAKAERYLKATIELHAAETDEISLGWAYYSLARFYRNEDQIPLAISALDSALVLHRKNGLKGGVADVLLEMGLVYLAQQRHREAIPALEESLILAKEIPLFPNIRDATAALAEAHAAADDYDQAYHYLEQSNVYKDSTFHETLNRQIAESNARYENEKLEKSVAERELEVVREKAFRNRVLGIMGVVLLLALAAFQVIYYRQKRRKVETDLALKLQSTEAERLRALNELKSNFFTNISHELRTPLTLILSPLADVIEQVRATPLRAKLELVQRNARQLLNLVNEIMDISKAEVGKLSIHPSTVDLTQLVKRIFSSYESLASIRRITYRVSIDYTNNLVEIDVEKFEKIMNNLLANAIKFTASGGTVNLDVRQQGTDYTFTVKDTGQGIHPDDQARIFDRFYQAQKSQGLKGGTGIGLALVKELSQLLGGTITCETTWKEGSSFILMLPLPVARQAPLVAPAFTEIMSKAGVPNYAPLRLQEDKARLLIVEDHPEMGKYLLEVLSEHYQCVLASDGEQALKQLRLSSFDAITSDVMMPNMDGFQLREAMNQRKEWRRVPFLLLTARHLEEDKLRGFQLGIDDYITKPFSTRELNARLKNLIQNKKEREEYAATQTEESEPLSVDQSLLKALEDALLARLDDEEFKVEDLAKAIHYSTKQMGRLLKQHTGLSSVQFILEIRLQKARTLLAQRQCATVLEAQFAVGIRSTSYFTRKFTERFGKNPRDFLSGV